jgi:cellulose synthase/poly-beta-1,6-N-acetylglucosamine synthase-like glycosyltransferase
MLFLEIVLLALTSLLLLPVGVLFVECVSAAFSVAPRRPQVYQTPNLEVRVLVPAHNEALGITHTLQSLLPQVDHPEQIIVIADNCSDATAAVARSTGVTVIERQHQHQRGKGYALDFGLRHLAAHPPDVVVFVDADCVVEPGSLQQIVQQAHQQQRPVQAVYLLEQAPQPTTRDVISALAFRVKNLVRPTGLRQLNLPCLLAGTGMAFPWHVTQAVHWASGNLVEDMQLALDLAVAGYPAQLCPSAQVTGSLPQQAKAAQTQRTRWEHGHLQTLMTQAPKLIAAAIARQRLDLFMLALDLAIPPLALLVLLWSGMMAVALGGGVALQLWASVWLLGLEGLMLFVAIVLAWSRFCREQVPLQMLLSVPLYILWKIPLYFAFLVKPQTQWVRTARDEEAPGPAKS